MRANQPDGRQPPRRLRSEMGNGMYIGRNAENEPVVYEAFEPERCVKLECFFTAFRAEYDGGYSFEGEIHDFWEMFCVLEGKACVSADERICRLSAGDVIFHKPMELHRFHIENGNPLSVFVLSFDASGPVMKKLENRVLTLEPEQKNCLLRMTELVGAGQQPGEECSAPVLRLKSQPLKFQQFTCLTELFLLSATDSGSQLRPEADPPEALLYREAVRVMHAHMRDWPDVPVIASECGVSPSCLKQVFRKYAGLGVHRYFLTLKIIQASRMLKEGRSVAAIAEELSFSSPNYFSIVYKRETGITPTAYRHR